MCLRFAPALSVFMGDVTSFGFTVLHYSERWIIDTTVVIGGIQNTEYRLKKKNMLGAIHRDSRKYGDLFESWIHMLVPKYVVLADNLEKRRGDFETTTIIYWLESLILTSARGPAVAVMAQRCQRCK
jgi:hypothetical protein